MSSLFERIDHMTPEVLLSCCCSCNIKHDLRHRVFLLAFLHFLSSNQLRNPLTLEFANMRSRDFLTVLTSCSGWPFPMEILFCVLRICFGWESVIHVHILPAMGSLTSLLMSWNFGIKTSSADNDVYICQAKAWKMENEIGRTVCIKQE